MMPWWSQNTSRPETLSHILRGKGLAKLKSRMQRAWLDKGAQVEPPWGLKGTVTRLFGWNARVDRQRSC